MMKDIFHLFSAPAMNLKLKICIKGIKDSVNYNSLQIQNFLGFTNRFYLFLLMEKGEVE